MNNALLNVKREAFGMYLERKEVRERLKALLKENADSFTGSLLHIVSNNAQLKSSDPNSVIQAALLATWLNLPINNQLGFAHIVPYRSPQGIVATFQLGYKGYIQLAIRSNQFRHLSVVKVKQGQLIEYNPLKGHRFDFSVQSDQTIGYVSYFSLKGGFEKQLYMSLAEIEAHAQKYSGSYKSGYGVWKENFEAMAEKTVLKRLLHKYAPLSLEMQRALRADSAVIKDAQKDEVLYIDNQKREAISSPAPDTNPQENKTCAQSDRAKPDRSVQEKKQIALSAIKPSLKNTLVNTEESKEALDFEKASTQEKKEALEKQNAQTHEKETLTL